MDGQDKGIEMMEPMLNKSQDSMNTDDSMRNVTGRKVAVNIGFVEENTGRFGIGPKKLAKYADVDASHTIVDGQDERVGAKLL